MLPHPNTRNIKQTNLVANHAFSFLSVSSRPDIDLKRVSQRQDMKLWCNKTTHRWSHILAHREHQRQRVAWNVHSCLVSLWSHTDEEHTSRLLLWTSKWCLLRSSSWNNVCRKIGSWWPHDFNICWKKLNEWIRTRSRAVSLVFRILMIAQNWLPNIKPKWSDMYFGSFPQFAGFYCVLPSKHGLRENEPTKFTHFTQDLVGPQ